MTLFILDLLLLGMLSASIHWLVARAQITRPFWSRTRGWLAKLLACPACSGFWIGCGLTATSLQAAAPFFLRQHDAAFTIASILTNGLLAMFLTPIFEAVMIWGLHLSAIPTESGERDD